MKKLILSLLTLIAVSTLVAQTTDTSPRFLTTLTFATLGTPANGAIVYCSDCTSVNPCAGSGSGALAKRENGAWNCATPGGSTAFLDSQDATTAIAMTGSDVTIYSTSIPGGTIASGHCLFLEVYYKTNSAGTSTDFKVSYGATSVTIIGAQTATNVQETFTMRFCNNVGSTAAQSGYQGVFSVNGTGTFAPPAPFTGWTTDSTATQTFAVKANAASGNVQGVHYHLTVDR